MVRGSLPWEQGTAFTYVIGLQPGNRSIGATIPMFSVNGIGLANSQSSSLRALTNGFNGKHRSG